MSMKTIVTGLLALGMSMPLLAQAQDLTIYNQTNYDSTSVINNGACSYPLLQEDGITKANSQNSIPYKTMQKACGTHPTDCKAEIYMTGNCSGPIVATVIYNITNGTASKITINDPSYIITSGSYSLTIAGGPAK